MLVFLMRNKGDTYYNEVINMDNVQRVTLAEEEHPFETMYVVAEFTGGRVANIAEFDMQSGEKEAFEFWDEFISTWALGETKVIKIRNNKIVHGVAPRVEEHMEHS